MIDRRIEDFFITATERDVEAVQESSNGVLSHFVLLTCGRARVEIKMSPELFRFLL
jgi:hypothetical protein